jgi:hypothetical protein
MNHLLAAQITIYVGGLIAFAPNDTGLELLLLRDNSFWNSHNMEVGSHDPVLLIRGDDLDVRESHDYEMIGGIGSEQLARFQLSEVIDLGPADPKKPDMSQAYLAPVGSEGLCDGKLKSKYEQKWPVEARLQFPNAVVTAVTKQRACFRNSAHQTCHGNIEIAERLEIKVEVKDTPVFKRNGKVLATLLKTAMNPTLSVWNLPRGKVSASGSPHQGSHHFAAFYSLLEKRNGCSCLPYRLTEKEECEHDLLIAGTLGSQPIFCPPARAR